MWEKGMQAISKVCFCLDLWSSHLLLIPLFIELYSLIEVLTGIRENINFNYTIILIHSMNSFPVIKSEFQNTIRKKYHNSGNCNRDSLSIEMKSYQMSWEHCLETLKIDNLRREMINISYIPLGIFLLIFLWRKHWNHFMKLILLCPHKINMNAWH